MMETPGSPGDPVDDLHLAPPPAPLPSGQEDARPLEPRAGGLREWLLRTQAIRDARAYTHAVPLRQRERLRRAMLAAELGDRVLDPVDPLRGGSGAGLALGIYREAAYWALLAQNDVHDDSDLKTAFANADRSLLLGIVGGEERLQELQRFFVEGTFVDSSREREDVVHAWAVQARGFVHALLHTAARPVTGVTRLKTERAVRLSLTAFVVIALIAVAGLGIRSGLRKPDLAAGKPWRASSEMMKCQPAEHYCGGTRTDILFHTNDEDSPWFEIDLQKPTVFSTVEVTNRSDSVPDRAIPLVVEVSNDRMRWTEVAKRTETFSVWTAKLAPQNARYVRVRVLRKTILHLEGVAVR